MEKNSYFQDALARFTSEVAAGGAIRHLADIGYTVRQITERLDFPMPYARVQQEVWEYLVRKEVILLAEPGSGVKSGRMSFVREYDRFGKASFRQIVEPEEQEKIVCWKEHLAQTGESVRWLRSLWEENGGENSYGSCDFGLLEGETFKNRMQILDKRQQEYIAGLPWMRQKVYHQLDMRMLEILLKLYEAGMYRGEWFFLRTREKITLCPCHTSSSPSLLA